jgi:hypothetical protein
MSTEVDEVKHSGAIAPKWHLDAPPKERYFAPHMHAWM